jgi:hypothetical protein
VSDLCGEKLAEAFVAKAVTNACRHLGINLSFAMLAPEADSSGRWNYTLFVEGDAPPELATKLDDELRENPHYAHCRSLEQLDPIKVFRIAVNAYETFCKAGSEDLRLGDIKPQALSSRTNWREHFAEF